MKYSVFGLLGVVSGGLIGLASLNYLAPSILGYLSAVAWPSGVMSLGSMTAAISLFVWNLVSYLITHGLITLLVAWLLCRRFQAYRLPLILGFFVGFMGLVVKSSSILESIVFSDENTALSVINFLTLNLAVAIALACAFYWSRPKEHSTPEKLTPMTNSN